MSTHWSAWRLPCLSSPGAPSCPTNLHLTVTSSSSLLDKLFLPASDHVYARGSSTSYIFSPQRCLSSLPLDCGLAGFSIVQFSNRLKKKKKKALAINFKFIWLFFIVRVGGILLSPAFSVQEKKPEALSTTLPFYLTF